MTSTGFDERRPDGLRIAYRSVVTDFGRAQWVVVVLSVAWLAYAALQFGLAVLRPGVYDLDYFLVINGGLFLAVVWWAALIWRRIRELFDALWSAGNMLFESRPTRDRVFGEIRRQFNIISIVVAVVVTISIFIGNLAYYDLLQGGYLDFEKNLAVQRDGSVLGEAYYFVALIPILIVAGGFSGYILGQMIGVGRILPYLRRNNRGLSGFTSDSGTVTLRRFERMFETSLLCTTAISLACSGWWAVWQFTSVARGYNDYLVLFNVLGTIGYVCFFLAAYYPILRFDAELNTLYGGPQARSLAAQQVRLTRDDIAENERRLGLSDISEDERERLEDEQRDLRAYLMALGNRHFNSPLLKPAVLHVMLAFNTAVVIPPWIGYFFFPLP